MRPEEREESGATPRLSASNSLHSSFPCNSPTTRSVVALFLVKIPEGLHGLQGTAAAFERIEGPDGQIGHPAWTFLGDDGMQIRLIRQPPEPDERLDELKVMEQGLVLLVPGAVIPCWREIGPAS